MSPTHVTNGYSPRGVVDGQGAGAMGDGAGGLGGGGAPVSVGPASAVEVLAEGMVASAEDGGPDGVAELQEPKSRAIPTSQVIA